MKRTISCILALLVLAGCFPACADEYYWNDSPTEWAWYTKRGGVEHADYYALQDILRDAGRYTVAQEVYAYDHTRERLMVVVIRDEGSQMTLLTKMEDGQWKVEAVNDTIPFQQFNDNTVCWTLNETDEDAIPRDRYGYYILNSDQTYDGSYYVELVQTGAAFYGQPDYEPGNWLRFYLYPDADGWYIQRFELILYEQETNADAYKAPYYILWQDGEGDWKLRYYEVVDFGYGLERVQDPLYTATLNNSDILPLLRLDGFDYPAFVAYLSGLLPDDLPDAYTVAKSIYETPQNDGPADPEQTLVLAEDACVYYNPNGGRYYHAVEDCASVSDQYLPLTPIPCEQLDDAAYSRLVPCPYCNPPERTAILKAVEALKALAADDSSTEPAAGEIMVYFNPAGGRYYHAEATCYAVDERYWPLTAISIEQLNTPNYSRLMPCPKCSPPERPPVETTDEN